MLYVSYLFGWVKLFSKKKNRKFATPNVNAAPVFSLPSVTLTAVDRDTRLIVSPGKHFDAGQQRSKRATRKLPKMRDADRYARVSRGIARSVSDLQAILRDSGEHASRDAGAGRVTGGIESAGKRIVGQRPICEYYRRSHHRGSTVGCSPGLPGNAQSDTHKPARWPRRHSIASPLTETQTARHNRAKTTVHTHAEARGDPTGRRRPGHQAKTRHRGLPTATGILRHLSGYHGTISSASPRESSGDQCVPSHVVVTLTAVDRDTRLIVSPGKHFDAGQQRSKRATRKLPKMRDADRYARVSRGIARSVSDLQAILRDSGEHASRIRG